MPINTEQSRAALHTYSVSWANPVIDALPGDDFHRWYIPDNGRADQGIVVRSVRATTGALTGSGTEITATVDVQNETTSILAATIAITTTLFTKAATLDDTVSGFGDPTIVKAGRYLSFDLGGGNADTGYKSVTIQVNYDDWPGTTPARTA